MTLGRDALVAFVSLGVAGACVMRAPFVEPTTVAAPKNAPRPTAPPTELTVRSAELPAPAPRVPVRGIDFPDGVLALTWDDGPDAHTLELARFLHDRHVAGTFFVVGSWIEGLSEEPGYGRTKLATGYDYLPVLSELVALGHRVGNHARNHVLLGHATPELAREQFQPLPLPGERVLMFRAPGGWFTSDSAAAFDQPSLADFIGPIHWDIDAKDWESSLFCRSDDPEGECERGPKPNEPRVRPDVIARRYLTKIDTYKKGIVLMHDRVGDVGSNYALEVARALIPELIARDYVFVGPIMRFGPMNAANVPAGSVHHADINGDGRADTCESTTAGVSCALASASGYKAASIWSPEKLAAFTLADVNGDGRADLCGGSRCALAP